jgi:DNA invertase Pin-like site-specific DNA recombinase
MSRQVTVIPAIKRKEANIISPTIAKKRVAAYARVSTGSEEQLTSYEAQVDYYTKYITSKPEWKFVGIYTDEGITAVNTKYREGFNRMIEDALAGKIDLIITKSVSRFARNTVDSLVTVRKLREKGVEVYFEKENIYTLDSKGELLITIMSSLAQEESRNLSENVRWGYRKRFADGKVSLPYGHFLGYEKGKDGLPKIVEKEAKIVRRIYKLFMEGKTPRKIAEILTEEGIPTPSGKNKWRGSTILSILTNEKYKGSALLQKKFTVDFLTKKQKINEGEVPQYFVENSHDAIIDPTEFELVQAELARRKSLGKKYSCLSPFSAKIVCGECGNFYGSKVWHSNSKYKRTIWQCNAKFKNKEKCKTPHLYEEDVKKEFISAFNSLIENKDEILDNCRLIQDTLTDCTSIDAEIDSLYCEIDVVTELTKKLVEENSQNSIDQNEYQSKYTGYVKRYETAKIKLEKLQEQRQQRLAKRDAIGAFMFELSERDEILTEFDERLWNVAVERVVVNNNNLTIKFKSKVELDAKV